MMAEGEVPVDGSKLSDAERCRERVRALFGVTSETSFIALGNEQPCKIRLHCAGVDAKENFEKARRYLESVIGGSQDIERKEISLAQPNFDMVLKHHDQIESRFQVFADFKNPCVLKVQGYPERIRSTEEFITRIIAGEREPTTLDHENTASINCDSENLQSSTSDYFTDGSLLSPTPSDFLRSDEGSKDSGEYTSSSQGWLPREPLKARGSAPEMQQTPVSFVQGEGRSSESCDSGSFSSRSVTPESDNDVAKLTSTPEYTAKLEKAVRLGYSEEQLIQALQKLGFEADQNQVLSEMIKLGSTSKVSQDEGSVSGENVDSFEEDGPLERRKEIIDDSSNLRHIVIDGSNVAMSHGKDVFSCQGIKLAVDWFRERGHENITVFVPQWRKETSRPDAPITDQEILLQLEKDNILSFTPARRVGGRRMVCYDDRYILNLAAQMDGIVVSNDNYRDLINEKPEFKKVVEERLLMYTFASNRFMPPDDPLGRRGPSLDNFLRKEHTVPEPLPQECPYGKKCTYGNKCRYYHPERKNQPHQLITDKLREQAKQKLQERASRPSESAVFDKKKLKEPLRTKKPLARTSSIFPPGLADELVAPSLSDSTEQTQKQDYNEKLNEARKKLEQAEILNRKAHVPNDEEQFHQVVGQHAPSFSTGQQDNQLKVPHSQPKEGLVSGHLLLAKKLSDEAQDANFFRSEGSVSSDELCRSSPQSFSYPSSPHRPVTHLSAGIPDIPYYSGQEPVQRPVTGSHDRSPRHMPREHGTCHSVPSMLMRQDASASSLDYGPRYQSFPLPNADYIPHQATKQEQFVYPTPHEEYYEHSVVNRFPSAPGTTHLRQASSMPQMRRQNSTSDPQIHMAGADMELAYMSGNGYQRQAPQQQYNPYQGQSQGQGYTYRSWGESPSDIMSQSGMRAIQKSYPPLLPGQFPPAGQERKMNTDYGRQVPWVGPPMQNLPPPPAPPGNLYSPQQPSSMMSNMSYQQQAQQPIHQQINMTPVEFQQPFIPPDAPIRPSDNRFTMYYHLCGLFPETKVLAVMNMHPNETDPKVLCQYIMNYGECI